MEPVLLTEEQIEEKRKSIEGRLGVPVSAFCFMADGKQIVGFTKEAPRITKMRAFDRMLISITDACDILLTAMLIAEESSPEIIKDDKAYMSALLQVQGVLNPYSNTLKKN